MHICIPDTREVRPPQGNAYLLYNIHIDGLYHCSLRYKQLLQLHQALTKYFNALNQAATNKYQTTILPQFPPKKLLPLSVAQTEERRQQLEKYLQNISQDKAISNSSIFNLFLLEAQRESTRIKPNQVHLDIELVNGQKIRLQIVTHDSADSILKAVCRALNLKDRYHAYFCLCLCGYDVVRDKLIIKRRLSFFESPYITLQMAIQQQEQLQNVLVSTTCNCVAGNNNNNNNSTINTSNSTSSTTGSGSTTSNGYSSMSSQSSSSSSSNCRCLSCSTRNFQLHHHHHHQQQHHQQQANLTDVPSMCSSSGSHSVNSNNNNNLYDNSNSENYNDIDSSHYNNNNNNNNNCNPTKANDNNNNINRNNNNHSQQCYYTNTNSYNQDNWLTTSTSSSTSRSFVTHRILLRKSYWDPIYDTYILNDQQALNLLFIQTVYDMKHSLMFVDRETYHRLESLLATDQKLEYILMARTLKYYNHVHFEPCYSDYPRPRTKVMISIGSRELNMRVLKSPKSILSTTIRGNRNSISTTTSNSTVNNNNNNSTDITQSGSVTTGAERKPTLDHTSQTQATNIADEPILYCTSSLVPNGYHHLITKEDLVEEEYSFKVPLIRCWRLTSLETLNNNNGTSGGSSGGGGSIFGHRSSSSTATTTLAGGKRKSLSLFNGVIGNAMSSNGTNKNDQQHRYPPPGNNQFSSTSGTDGRSLLAAAANLVDASNSARRNMFADDQFNNNDPNNGCSAGCCNRTTMENHCNHPASLAHMDHAQFIQYELSFEYLIAKDTLRWITISSDQAIFISISLQGVVDELVSKRDGLVSIPYGMSPEEITRGHSTHRDSSSSTSLLPPLDSNHSSSSNILLLQQQQLHQQHQTFTYMYRDGSQKIMNLINHQPIERFVSPLTSHLPIQHPPVASQHQHNLHHHHHHHHPRQQRQQQYQQQSRASSLFSSFASSASGSASSSVNNTVRGLISVWSSSDLAGSTSTGIASPMAGSAQHSSCCGQQPASTFEISSFRKEPSPIINDAFEGVMANDDDL